MDETNKHTHIAVFPSPGAGHLIPLAELVRWLLLINPSISFTFIILPNSSSDDPITTTRSALSALPATAIDIVALPPPSFPNFANIEDEIYTRVLRSTNLSLPVLRQTVQKLTSQRHVAAFIVDIFATEVIQVGLEFGIKSSIFFSSSAIGLSLFLQIHKLDETTSRDEWVPERELKLPGCPVLKVKDLPEPLQNRNWPCYKWFIEHSKRFESAEAIILNSLEALEDGPVRALREAGPGKPPFYVVGPLVRMGSRKDHQSECLRWLDKQPPRSVLYVSFGSGGTLSTKQVTELAWGLELSEQRFLWVVRSPNDTVSYGTYLSLEEENDPLGFLPKGFLERTKGRGLVVQSWAPQVEILSHGSTGGFLTHCGWNSILEGLVNGVGFIAWPLYAEQRVNAAELVEDVKVALRVEKNDDGLAERSQIAKVVRTLMEGEEGVLIEGRMRRLQDEARMAVEKNGSSSLALSELSMMWKAR